jgi:hypothetical protein
MRIEKKKVVEKSYLDYEQDILDAYYDYREYENLERDDAIQATARLMSMESEDVEKVLIKNKVYEDKENKIDEEEKDKKKDDDSEDKDKDKKKDDEEKSDKDSDDKEDDDEDEEEKDEKKKKEEVITIEEDVDIPGTEYTLEKGDKIQVLKEEELQESHLENVREDLYYAIASAYREGGPEYVMKELRDTFKWMAKESEAEGYIDFGLFLDAMRFTLIN